MKKAPSQPQVLKIKFLGIAPPEIVQSDLLLNIIGRVSQRQVELTDTVKDADLLIVHPYIVSELAYKFRWLINFFAKRILKSGVAGKNNLRWMLGTGNKKTLFVSNENLDRPYWWNMIGKFLVESDVPRLTYWPSEVDPDGARFPYWYNYVDWPEYPRPDFYKRFGRLYKIDDLMAPLPVSRNRKDKAVSISSHLDHPRKALLKHAQKYIEVDSFGASGTRFKGPKIELMQQYKYAFCPENSTGYGYDTEKLPEAWVAGCIPIGISINPFSEFNPNVVRDCEEAENVCLNNPLLVNYPTLKKIEEYLCGIL